MLTFLILKKQLFIMRSLIISYFLLVWGEKVMLIKHHNVNRMGLFDKGTQGTHNVNTFQNRVNGYYSITLLKSVKYIFLLYIG